MSKTVPFEYRGQLFWVFDVCESVLFAEMVDIAAQVPARERTPWLAGLEQQLRVDAIVGASHAIPLEQWCDGHEDGFIALAARAANRLGGRGSITAQQAAWVDRPGRRSGPLTWPGQRGYRTGRHLRPRDDRHHPRRLPAAPGRPALVLRPCR